MRFDNSIVFDCIDGVIESILHFINNPKHIPGYCIYLTGSKFYDESDDDWACDIDFEPNRKYLMLASGSIQNMNWKQILYKVKNIIFNFITANAYKLPLFVGKIVTIGFDDGDLVRIQ